MRRIEDIDLTVIQELERFIDKVQESGGEVILCGVTDKVLAALKSYGIIDKLKKGDVFVHDENIFSSTKEAIDKAKRKYLE
ncbi:MAG: STAS domain-containing protein [Halanaerobiaceae bacterium]